MIEPEHIQYLRDVQNRVGQAMFGLDNVTGVLLTALISGGHVLLEGNPGLGKTALVRALGQALGFRKDRIGRIQFTPDLMPSDITGTKMPFTDNTGRTELKFEKGPIFHWLLIADEINRATPKTQSAMLEAMAERQVTVLGETLRIDRPEQVSVGGVAHNVTPPFLVMATQNPIDQEGTYDLPEAQSDRFMFKVRMPFPNYDVLDMILSKDAGARHSVADTEAHENTEGAALHRIEALRESIRDADVLPAVRTHILNIVLASNGIVQSDMELPGPRAVAVSRFVERYIDYALGPRAGTSLLLGVKGWAAAMLIAPGQTEIGSETGDALFWVALPCLRHRLKLRFGWQRLFREEYGVEDNVGDDDLRDRAIAEFITLCAPGSDSYAETVRNGFNVVLAQAI